MRYIAILAIFALVGCSSDDGDNHNHEDEHANNHENNTTANNSSSSGVDTYVDGLMKMGDEGNFHIMLMSATPAPPDLGENTWTFRIIDADDNPINGAKVTVEPFMPAHGHGTSPAEFTATFSEDGTYEVGPMDLFMPGVWETTVRVEGESTDATKFNFELEG